MTKRFSSLHCEDRVLLVDDTDEDMTQLLTVICDGDPRGRRGDDEKDWPGSCQV